MKRYGPRTCEWRDVQNPRKYHIGDTVVGKGRNGKYDGVPGKLIRSIWSKGAIWQGYYIIEYPDGETRTFNVIEKL